MVSPLYLTLLVGPMEPLPAPKPLADALVSVEVTESATGRSGFQLTFTLADKGILETFFLLAGSSPLPILRVVLLVTFPGIPQVLVDGVVLHTEVQPDAMSGSSKLVVSGQDLTAMMDLIDFSGLPYPGMSPDIRVLTILAKYAMIGIVPEVIPVPAPDIPIPLLQIPTQKKTDLKYIEQLAREVGYVFYLVPGPLPGMNQAYWGPQMRLGVPQTALNVNLDTWTNVESLNFRYEPQTSVLPIVFIQDPLSKINIPIPIPPVTPFNPPLGLAVPIPSTPPRPSCADSRAVLKPPTWSPARARSTSCAMGSRCAPAASWVCVARAFHGMECTTWIPPLIASSPESTRKVLC